MEKIKGSPSGTAGNIEEVKHWPFDFLSELCDRRQWLQISNIGDLFLSTSCMLCIYFSIPCQPAEQSGGREVG